MALTQIYTPEEAAALLKVSRRTVYSYIRDGRLVAHRPGPRKLVIRADAIEKFLSVPPVAPGTSLAEPAVQSNQAPDLSAKSAPVPPAVVPASKAPKKRRR